MKKKYQGIVIPTVTPLTAKRQLDHEAIEKMFSNFRNHQVLPFILGTTGEASSIPVAIKHDFIKKAGKLKQAGDVLYTGIASNCIEESVALAKYCSDNGTDVVAATLPSYYVLTETQMRCYFEQLAEAIPCPLIIYNIPATTHMSIPLVVIDELSHHPKIVGVKDSEKNEERIKQSLALWSHREDFSYFLGWAGRSAMALAEGADGLIPSTGNFYPKLYADMPRALAYGNTEALFRLQELSDLLGNLYQADRTLGQSLAALKVLMSQAGLCEPNVMPPLQNLTAEERGKLLSDWAKIKNDYQIELEQ